MIFYDPTERDANSHLRAQLETLGQPMPGLERATGADFAIVRDNSHVQANDLTSNLTEPVARLARSTELTNADLAAQVGAPLPAILQIMRFRNATLQRGLLVQRKSGSDLLNSIPNLTVVLEKMLLWTRAPWLLLTGQLAATADHKASLNGRRSDYHYFAVIGALDAWLWRGGFHTHLENDNLIGAWLRLKEQAINKAAEPQKIIVPFKLPLQTLVATDDEEAWLTTLMTFPGIGPALAQRLADTYCDLARVLCFLSDETALQWTPKPEGFGPITLAKARQRLGLEAGERLMIVGEEQNNGQSR